MPAMASLAGKVALVTGSTSGIGLEVLKALAGAGANVCMHGLGDRAALTATLAKISADFGVQTMVRTSRAPALSTPSPPNPPQPRLLHELPCPVVPGNQWKFYKSHLKGGRNTHTHTHTHTPVLPCPAYPTQPPIYPHTPHMLRTAHLPPTTLPEHTYPLLTPLLTGCAPHTHLPPTTPHDCTPHTCPLLTPLLTGCTPRTTHLPPITRPHTAHLPSPHTHPHPPSQAAHTYRTPALPCPPPLACCTPHACPSHAVHHTPHAPPPRYCIAALRG